MVGRCRPPAFANVTRYTLAVMFNYQLPLFSRIVATIPAPIGVPSSSPIINLILMFSLILLRNKG